MKRLFLLCGVLFVSHFGSSQSGYASVTVSFETALRAGRILSGHGRWFEGLNGFRGSLRTVPAFLGRSGEVSYVSQAPALRELHQLSLASDGPGLLNALGAELSPRLLSSLSRRALFAVAAASEELVSGLRGASRVHLSEGVWGTIARTSQMTRDRAALLRLECYTSAGEDVQRIADMLIAFREHGRLFESFSRNLSQIDFASWTTSRSLLEDVMGMGRIRALRALSAAQQQDVRFIAARQFARTMGSPIGNATYALRVKLNTPANVRRVFSERTTIAEVSAWIGSETRHGEAVLRGGADTIEVTRPLGRGWTLRARMERSGEQSMRFLSVSLDHPDYLLADNGQRLRAMRFAFRGAIQGTGQDFVSARVATSSRELEQMNRLGNRILRNLNAPPIYGMGLSPRNRQETLYFNMMISAEENSGRFIERLSHYAETLVEGIPR